MSIFINIFLLYLNIYFCFTISGIINLPFKKQIPDLKNISPENIIYYGLQHNKIITEIKIGTEPQKISMIIDLSHYNYFISGETEKYINNNNLVFNQSKSTSFNIFEKFGDFGGRGFTIGYKANDYFYFNNEIDKKYYLSFILALDPDDDISGMIGLKLNEKEDEEIIEYNFINQLKKVNAIKDYYFTIKYNNNTHGNLIIGDLPEKYDNNLKNIEYRDIYINNPNSPTSWNIQIDSIYTKFENDKEINDLGEYIIYFRIDLGITIGGEEYRQDFLNSFMTNQIKNGICQEILSTYYYTYFCKNTINFSKMKNLYFYNKELNYSFEFTYKELFFYNELDNNYYFLIEFEKDAKKNNRWLIGEFFFKKYQLIFNQDLKKLGIYTGKLINENDNNEMNKGKNGLNKNIWLLILIIFLIVLVIVIGFLLYYILITKPKRKKKANELIDDDYEYPINNNSTK